MTTQSALAKIPLPELVDRVDGPTAFSNFAKKVEDIAVVPYANSAARTQAYAAISPTRTPLEGTLTYLLDTNAYEFWTGTAWAPLLPDTYPMGIVNFKNSDTAFPSDGSYVPVATQRITDLSMTQKLTAGRVYRISTHGASLDGGPGASPTGRGGGIDIKYTSNGTIPVVTNSSLVYMRNQVQTDDAYNATGFYIERLYQPPATGIYGFAVFVRADGTGGVRLSGNRQLVIEDLGKPKPAA